MTHQASAPTESSRTESAEVIPTPGPAALMRPSPSRRQLFKAAGLVALVGVGGSSLASCSSGSTTTPAASTTPSSSAPSSSAPSSSAPSSVAAPSSEASSAAPSASDSAKASGPSVSTAEVPVGGGFIMPNADFVVTQPTKGTYKAFSKICTHQGCPVTKIVNKEIVCPCHQSLFSITDGSVISGPAQSPLPESKTRVAGGKVIVSA